MIRITTAKQMMMYIRYPSSSYASFTTHLHLQEMNMGFPTKIEQKCTDMLCSNVRQIDKKIDVKIIMTTNVLSV